MDFDAESVKTVWTWVAALATFGIWSVLYRENRLFRFFEHVFIGVAIGFGFFVTWSEVLQPMWWQPMVTMNEVIVTEADNAPRWIGGTIGETALPAELVEQEQSSASIQWDTREFQTLVHKPDSTNWINAHIVELWVHSPEASNQQVAIVVVSDNENTPVEDLFWHPIPLDYAGWQKFKAYKRDFQKQGEPTGFDRVNELRFSTNPAFVTNPYQGILHLDRVASYAGRRWYWALAFVIGAMFYTVFLPGLAWMNRYALGLLMGLEAGIAIKGFVLVMFPQIIASFKPLTSFNNIVYMLVLACVMVYFFFIFEQNHPAVRGTAQAGRWFLMICFGVIFGNTIMGRLSLFIERLQFLWYDWFIEALPDKAAEPLVRYLGGG